MKTLNIILTLTVSLAVLIVPRFVRADPTLAAEASDEDIVYRKISPEELEGSGFKSKASSLAERIKALFTAKRLSLRTKKIQFSKIKLSLADQIEELNELTKRLKENHELQGILNKMQNGVQLTADEFQKLRTNPYGAQNPADLEGKFLPDTQDLEAKIAKKSLELADALKEIDSAGIEKISYDKSSAFYREQADEALDKAEIALDAVKINQPMTGHSTENLEKKAEQDLLALQLKRRPLPLLPEPKFRLLDHLKLNARVMKEIKIDRPNALLELKIKELHPYSELLRRSEGESMSKLFNRAGESESISISEFSKMSEMLEATEHYDPALLSKIKDCIKLMGVEKAYKIFKTGDPNAGDDEGDKNNAGIRDDFFRRVYLEKAATQ